MKQYDVFLSFKQTSSSGGPTPESKIAEELHAFLQGRAIRVFCSSLTLKQNGIAQYKRTIDEALDNSTILVALGSSRENLEAEWVRYEWDSFFNDILMKRKPDGRLFAYTINLPLAELPRTLVNNQVIAHSDSGFETLHSYITNALAVGSVAQIAAKGEEMIARMHKIMEIIAESRILELEITQGMFGALLGPDKTERLHRDLERLKNILGK